MYFTDKEEEFTNLLIKNGTRKNIATVLVFLAKTPGATSHALERGTDLRQPEVSVSLRYLVDQGMDQILRTVTREEGPSRKSLRAGKTH